MTQMLKSEITTTDPHTDPGAIRTNAVTGMFTNAVSGTVRGIVR